MIAAPRAHHDDRVIFWLMSRGEQFDLLVGTRVYDSPLADYARKAGLDYELAKKRRQRAEARISPIGRPLGKS